MQKIIRETGHTIGHIYIKNGKHALDRDLLGYNCAAQFSNWVVLRDLDTDGECAPELASKLLPNPSCNMRLHIAVHALEAWLLADSENLGRFFGIPVKSIPLNPDSYSDPKKVFLELARKIRKRSVREALLPRTGAHAVVGPGYTSLITEFIQNEWDYFVASSRSPSLYKLVTYLQSLPGGAQFLP